MERDSDVVPSVHPHACGENILRFLLVLTYFGTSPRMWGKRLNEGVEFRLIRYIPTHVGKTIER